MARAQLACPNVLPFATFVWCRAWWRHLRRDRWGVKDELEFRVVRGPAGRMVGVAPLMLTKRPSFGPVQARCLQFVGADPNITEVRGALFEPEWEARGIRAVQANILDRAEALDWIHWTGIGSAASLALREIRPPPRWSNGGVCSVVDLPEEPDQLRASRGRNLKESLRKGHNSLARAGLPYRLEVLTGATGCSRR